MSTQILEDQILPMMVVQDKNTGDIVSQVFNFVDLIQKSKAQPLPLNQESKKFRDLALELSI